MSSVSTFDLVCNVGYTEGFNEFTMTFYDIL